MDFSSHFSQRARSLDVSGIRRVFELGASLRDPINLSIGQPDFPVPDAIKRAAVEAIDADKNGYTLTQGIPELRSRIRSHLRTDIGWEVESNLASAGPRDPALMVTAGTSGALVLAALAMLDAGDEYIIPDPYFVLYPSLGALTGAKPVLCNTYPEFRMTAAQVEPLITERTKFVLMVSPSNPTGVALTRAECRDLLDLCRSRNVLLVSDEIYDGFAFSEALDPSPPRGAPNTCPSPARFDGAEENVLVIRGFGKTYGVTGWRMGYVAGPSAVVGQMAKLQQYTYVCAPSMAQWGCIAALDIDMRPTVERYAVRRDMVIDALAPLTDVVQAGGAFYSFVRIPPSLGMTATEFSERAVEQNVLVIPGSVFSSRDTHFRLSFACPEDRLQEGLAVLSRMMGAGALETRYATG
jgi:aspartate/methionine/tyrosine aminotransferase